MAHKLVQVLIGLVLLAFVACSGGEPPPQQQAPFLLEPSKQTLEVVPGGLSSFVVLLKRQPGFADTINMTFEGLPDGITQRWSRDSENGDCTVLLKVDPETPVGEFTVTLKGESAQLKTASARGLTARGLTAQASNTQTVTIQVVQPAGNLPTPGGSGSQGFTLAFSPTFVGIRQGNTVSTITVVTPINGFSQDVTFSVANLPANVTVAVDQGGPNNQFLADKYKAFLRFSPGTNSIPGEYTVQVTARAANFARTEPLLVKVFPLGSSAPDFDLFADAVNVNLRQASSSVVSLRVVRHNGFTAPVQVEPQLAAFPGVSFVDESGNVKTDTVPIRLIASNSAPVTLLTFGLTFKATGGGITKQVQVGLRIDPKPGNQDSSFIGSLGNNFKTSTQPILSGLAGSYFVPGKLVGSDGMQKLKSDGKPDTSFGSNTGIAFADSVGSIFSSFSADQSLFLINTPTFPIRMVGRLLPSNSSSTRIDLAMVGFSNDGQQKLFKALDFSASIQSFGELTPVRAIAFNDRTVVTGTLDTSFLKCFLTVIPNNADVAIKKEFRFNPASSISSECNSIAKIPGNNSQFYVGGAQTNVVTTPIVARFGLDGELDKNFAGDGNAKLEGLGGINNVTAMVVQPNGKIVVGFEREGAIARLNTDGKFDTSFGQGGVVKLNPPNVSNNNNKGISRLVLGANNSIFAVIKNTTSATSIGSNIAKLDSSGALQTDFGNNGFLDQGEPQDIFTDPGPIIPRLSVLQPGVILRYFQ